MYTQDVEIKANVGLFETGDMVRYVVNPLDLKIYEVVDVQFGEEDLKNCDRFTIILEKIINRTYSVQVKYKKVGDVFFTFISDEAKNFQLIEDAQTAKEIGDKYPEFATELNKKIRTHIYKNYSTTLDTLEKKSVTPEYYEIISSIKSMIKVYPDEYVELAVNKYGIEKLKNIRTKLPLEDVHILDNIISKNTPVERVVESTLEEPGHSNLVDKFQSYNPDII